MRRPYRRFSFIGGERQIMASTSKLAAHPFVMPAKAGIHTAAKWIPAYAGMTSLNGTVRPFSFIGCERSDHVFYFENRLRFCSRRVTDPAGARVTDLRQAGVTLKA